VTADSRTTRPLRAGLRLVVAIAFCHAGAALAARITTPPTVAPPAGVDSVAAAQAHIAFGKIASTGGPVALSTATDELSGAGLIGHSGPVSRGAITVTRARRATAAAVILAPPTSIKCGGSHVGIRFQIDNGGCATLAATPCTIFIGATLALPTLPAGATCTDVPITVMVKFTR
jgi:hypothetical protein